MEAGRYENYLRPIELNNLVSVSVTDLLLRKYVAAAIKPKRAVRRRGSMTRGQQSSWP